jgi:hypothetical protein
MRGVGKNQLEMLAPDPLRETFRLTSLPVQPISLDSSFKMPGYSFTDLQNVPNQSLCISCIFHIIENRSQALAMNSSF